MRRKREDQFPNNGFEAWGGYMNAKIAKLEEQYENQINEDKESNIFEGISIYVNGFTKPSSDELKTIMSKHGGTYHTYQRSGDFIIATNLADTKVKRLKMTKIVRPEWITDSLAANKVLDYKQYLLFSRHTKTQPLLQFNSKQSTSESNCRNMEIQKEKNLIIPEDHENIYESKTISEIEIQETKSERSPIHSLSSKLNLPANKLQSNLEPKNSLEPSTTSVNKGTVTARTAVDPNFLSEFYNNSRLHHISQLGATFKQYVNELRENSDFSFPARSKLKETIHHLQHLSESKISASDFKNGKLIMHIDMDCFFVSVGLRSRPELRGVPVAVTHARGKLSEKRPGVDRQTEFNLYRQKNAKSISKATGLSEDAILEGGTMKSRVDDLDIDGRGSMSEIASCSYEARAKGLKNGMFMGAALKLCPELKTIPYDFDGYKEVAYTLYNTVAKYTLDIEAVSCDELYADCTELAKELSASADLLARALRGEIREKTGCPCSTGFGGNRLQARLATKKAKPDGQYFLTSDLVDSFMMDIKISDLPGVGRQVLSRILGLCGGGEEVTCAALRPLPLATVQRHLGAAAARLVYNYCRGDDDRPLTFRTVRKSVSAEVNYGIRLSSIDERDAFLMQLCAELHSRLVKSACLAKCVTLKLMVRAADAPVETAKFMGHGFCDTINKSATLPRTTDDLDTITRHVLQLCNRLNVDVKEMRGVGVQLTKLEQKHGKRENALRAFLVKCGRKVDGAGKSSAEETDDFEVDASAKNEEVGSSGLSSWMCKTPTKRECGGNARTPVKLVLKSPSRLKSSPIKSPLKSPTKKKTLGLTGRRRGRPPKNASNIQTSKPASNTSCMQKFLAGERSNHATETIDPEILAALPEDIMREVLEYYQPSVVPGSIIARPASPVKTDSIKADGVKCDSDLESEQKCYELDPLPTKSLKPEPTTPQAKSPESSLLTLPWQQTRELLRSWLSADEPPLPCHVELVSSYMQNMVIDRNIDKLMVLINFLKRHVQELGNASWSSMYYHIIEGIQETMLAVYGKPLLIDR